MIQNKDKQLFETQKHLNEIQTENTKNYNIKNERLSTDSKQKDEKNQNNHQSKQKKFRFVFL